MALKPWYKSKMNRDSFSKRNKVSLIMIFKIRLSTDGEENQWNY